MFSPTHTPPLESASEDEGDSDLPLINLGTPKKPKLEPVSPGPFPPGASPSTSGSCVDQNDSTARSTASRKLSSAFSPPRPSSGEGGPPHGEPTAAPNSLRDHVFMVARGDVRAMADGIKHLSPLKFEPAGGSRGTSDSRRTANKVRKLSRSLKEKTAMEKKLEELRSRNGIQGIAKNEEEKSEAQQISPLPDMCELLTAQHSLLSVTTAADSSSLFPSLPPNCGRSVFVRTPSLISDLYPPGVSMSDSGLLNDLLVLGSEEDISKIVCGVLLPLSYVGQPCPVGLTQWLFQLLACAAEPKISCGALRSLLELMQQSVRHKTSFTVPTVSEISGVLVTLGAELDKLRPHTDSSGREVHTIAPDKKEVIVSVPLPPPPSVNLRNLIAYISACVKTLAESYTVPQLEELALIVCGLSLDRHCQEFLGPSLHLCLSRVLTAYPQRVWPKAAARLSAQLVCLSVQHVDHVAVGRLLRGTTQRELSLLREFCRNCLAKMVDLPTPSPEATSPSSANGGENDSKKTLPEVVCDTSTAQQTTTQDKERKRLDNSGVFAKSVLESYRKSMPAKMSSRDYQKLYYLLQLLQLHGLSCSGRAEQQEFLRVLGALKADIRDDPLNPITSQVKDLLIRMKVEQETERGRKGGTQRDLFSFS